LSSVNPANRETYPSSNQMQSVCAAPHEFTHLFSFRVANFW